MRGDGGATDLAGLPARARPHAVLRARRRRSPACCASRRSPTASSSRSAARPRTSPRSRAASRSSPTSRSPAMRRRCARSTCASSASPAARCCASARRTVYGVGPRSAHIAGLSYACFATARAARRRDAPSSSRRAPATRPTTSSSRCRDGARLALTNTCAANLLGITQPRRLRRRQPRRRRAAAFAIAGRGCCGSPAPRRSPAACSSRRASAIAELVAAVARRARPQRSDARRGRRRCRRPRAAMSPQMLGLDCLVPDGAEVISSIGDALSLVRAERELAARAPTPEAVASCSPREAREAAIAAGAAPASIDVRIEHSPERAALRAIATGAVGLHAGALPGTRPDRRRDGGRDPVARATATASRRRSARSGSATSTPAPIACSSSTASATPSLTRPATCSTSMPGADGTTPDVRSVGAAQHASAWAR